LVGVPAAVFRCFGGGIIGGEEGEDNVANETSEGTGYCILAEEDTQANRELVAGIEEGEVENGCGVKPGYTITFSLVPKL
jgi:hypothetical protein